MFLYLISCFVLFFVSDGAAQPSWRFGQRDLWVSLPAVPVFCALQRVPDPQGSVRRDSCPPQHDKDGTTSAAGAHGGMFRLVGVCVRSCASFCLLFILRLVLSSERRGGSAEEGSHRSVSAGGHAGSGQEGVRDVTYRIWADSCSQWASR